MDPDLSRQPAYQAIRFSQTDDGRVRYRDEDWEKEKDELQRQYLDQGLPLREVVKTMRERGFDAT